MRTLWSRTISVTALLSHRLQLHTCHIVSVARRSGKCTRFTGIVLDTTPRDHAKMLWTYCVAAVGFVPTVILYDFDSLPSSGCRNNRTLHLIRHAEGWHNVDELEAEAAFKAGESHYKGIDLKKEENIKLRAHYGIAWYLLERVTGDKYHDPHLTPEGRRQAYARFRT